MSTLVLLRAKPVTVEARQVLDAETAETIALWSGGWTSGTKTDPQVGVYTDTGQPAFASVGDWVIRGPFGRFYPAPDAVVQARYDQLASVTL